MRGGAFQCRSQHLPFWARSTGARGVKANQLQTSFGRQQRVRHFLLVFHQLSRPLKRECAIVCGPYASISSCRMLCAARRGHRTLQLTSARPFHATASKARELFDPNNVERASDEADVCIVGGGPAGLSAAIRLKQLEQEKGREVRVVVLEKGGEVGECVLRIKTYEHVMKTNDVS